MTIVISYEILKNKLKLKLDIKKVSNYYKNLIMIKLAFIDIYTTWASVIFYYFTFECFW